MPETGGVNIEIAHKLNEGTRAFGASQLSMAGGA